MSVEVLAKNFIRWTHEHGTIDYKIVNGTAYHASTPDAVVTILEDALRCHKTYRLLFCFGDADTGRDWGEENDTTGYIGRSTGDIKIPLLIAKKSDNDGGGFLDNCIVRIEKNSANGYKEIYRHAKYHK